MARWGARGKGQFRKIIKEIIQRNLTESNLHDRQRTTYYYVHVQYLVHTSVLRLYRGSRAGDRMYRYLKGGEHRFILPCQSRC